MLRVTLDTNTIDHRARIEAACACLNVELAYTTVTDRETEGTSLATSGSGVTETGVWNESRWGQFVWGRSVSESGVYDESRYDSGAVYAAQPVPETAVPGEWRLGEAALGGDESQPMLEIILRVIGGGSFPSQREKLTRGERRQLRDAMILEAHHRDRRDVLVTEDAKAFINDGRREALEALCKTRIMRVDEFCDGVAEMAK